MVKDTENIKIAIVASKFNTYMVGQNIIVDGGYSCV